MTELPSAGPTGTLITADGLSLARRRWPSPLARAVVVLVHGFAGSCTDGPVVRQAEALQAAGFDVRSYDSRGHGRSEGLCTLGDLESNDVAAAVAWAQDCSLPVILVGASMGAIAVLRYAASSTCDPGVAGVVTVSSPASWRPPRSVQGLLLAGLTQTWVGRAVAQRAMGVRLARGWSAPESPCQLVTRLNVPIAIVHGDCDRYIPARDASEIHRACTTPRRLDLVTGMGHAFDEHAVPVVSTAVEWLLTAGAAVV
jgi:alpha-beta hydrolase superfamily lysophospholipase